MEEINLLQNRVKDSTQIWGRQGRLVVIILSSILGLLLAGDGGLYLLSSSLQKNIDSVSNDTLTIRKVLDEKKKTLGDAVTFQAQLVNLRVLLDQHTVLSPLLEELSKVTYQKAQFFSLDVAAGKIHVEGKVADYGDLGKLLLGFSTSPNFSGVKLISVGSSSDKVSGYTFVIDMKASPSIYKKK